MAPLYILITYHAQENVNRIEEALEGGLPKNLLDESVEMQSRFLQFMELFADQVVVNFLAYRFLYGMRYQEYRFRK